MKRQRINDTCQKLGKKNKAYLGDFLKRFITILDYGTCARLEATHPGLDIYPVFTSTLWNIIKLDLIPSDDRKSVVPTCMGDICTQMLDSLRATWSDLAIWYIAGNDHAEFVPNGKKNTVLLSCCNCKQDFEMEMGPVQQGKSVQYAINVFTQSTDTTCYFECTHVRFWCESCRKKNPVTPNGTPVPSVPETPEILPPPYNNSTPESSELSKSELNP